MKAAVGAHSAEGAGARQAVAPARPGTGVPLAGVWWSAGLLMLFLLALGTRTIGLGGAVTEDEDQWIARSGTFAHGLTAGDWRRTYLTGHPGVTVMWLTTLTLGSARTMPFERGSGAPDVTTVPDFLPALDRARMPFAVLQAGLVVLVAVLAARLLGWRTGVVVGLLLAAEPFWAGVGPVVGMDGLLSGFLTVSLLALLLAIGLGPAAGTGPAAAVMAGSVPAPTPAAVGAHADALAADTLRARLAWAALAGVAFGFAFLTKTTALFLGPLVPALVLLLGWQGWQRRRAPAPTPTPGTDSAFAPDTAVEIPGRWWAAPLLVAGVWGLAAVLVVWTLWPAAWLTPVATLWRTLTFSANLGGSPHGPGNFLLGQSSDDPGPLFYPVALLVRLGPGTVIGLLLLFVLGVPRATRRVAWPLLGYVVLFVMLLTFAAKKVDRYLLPILPTLGILAAVGWLEGARRLSARIRHRREVAVAAASRSGGGGVAVLVGVAVLAFGLQVWPLVLAGR